MIVTITSTVLKTLNTGTVGMWVMSSYDGVEEGTIGRGRFVTFLLFSSFVVPYRPGGLVAFTNRF